MMQSAVNDYGFDWLPIGQAPKNGRYVLGARANSSRSKHGWVDKIRWSSYMGAWVDCNECTFVNPPTHFKPWLEPPLVDTLASNANAPSGDESGEGLTDA